MRLKVIERRNHGGKNPREQDCHLPDRVEVEVVRAMQITLRGEVGTHSCTQHERFPKKRWMLQKYGEQDHTEKPEIVQSANPPSIGRFGEFLPNRTRGAERRCAEGSMAFL